MKEQKEQRELKIGDNVVLKGQDNSPIMTVILLQLPDQVMVAWFDENHKEHKSFYNVNALEIYES